MPQSEMGLSGSLALYAVYGFLGGQNCDWAFFRLRSYVNISGCLVFWLAKPCMAFEGDKKVVDIS